MAKIALVGASGNIGGRVLEEALRRGHSVSGIVRNIDKLVPCAGLTIARGDLADPASVANVARGAEVLVVSIRWTDNADKVLETARLAGVPRLITVVGAGSLDAGPGLRVLDTAEFPAAWRPGAEGAARAGDDPRRAADRLGGVLAVVQYRTR